MLGILASIVGLVTVGSSCDASRHHLAVGSCCGASRHHPTDVSLRARRIVGLLADRSSSASAHLRAADESLRGRHRIAENEIMNDLFRPVTSEMAPSAAGLIAGELPADLPRGAVLKNGPNPPPEYVTKQGGWLDGDGMIHCVVLPPNEGGPAMYSRTWVRTSGFEKESQAGRRLFDGSLVAPRGLPLLWGLLVNGLRARQPQKDTANTGLLPLGGEGRCLALMEQCLPSELQVGADASVRTVGAGRSFDGALLDVARHPFAGGALTAHLKVGAGKLAPCMPPAVCMSSATN